MTPASAELQERFIQERVYLKGVSSATVAWYRDSFKAFEGALSSKAEIVARIAALRQRGCKNVSINTWLRCVNAYFAWREKEVGEVHLHIPRLAETQKVLRTLGVEDISKLLGYRPQSRNMRRAHLLIVLCLDTGLRLSEALNLRWKDVDFPNLLLRIGGKGDRERLVPMSFEGRKRLFGARPGVTPVNPSTGTPEATRHVFITRTGTAVSIRNAQRDVARVARNLNINGVRFSPHTLRHTFAVNYLRAGGNVLYLQRILGHSTLDMTNHYCRSLGVEDLQKVHDGLSLLMRR